MNNHLDLLKQYGPAAVMAAARDVAEMIGDVEEIGSSDVSAYVARVVQSLKDGSYADLAEGQGGNVMWKELDRVTRLERLRDLAKRMGDKEKFAKLDAEIKDIYSKPTTDEAIDPTNPRDYEIPAYLRKQQGQTPLTPADVKAKDEKAQQEFQKRVGNIEEADNLSTFEEGRCNMTAEGTECPKHGMTECWSQSAKDTGDNDMLSRLKALSGIVSK
jgi:hypothetical protein